MREGGREGGREEFWHDIFEEILLECLGIFSVCWNVWGYLVYIGKFGGFNLYWDVSSSDSTGHTGQHYNSCDHQLFSSSKMT